MRVFRGVLKFLLVFAALVLIAEGLLRIGLGLGNPILITPDAACNYIIKPNQNVFRFFGHTYINRYGMRSGEVPAHRIPHTLRLMFVGDSIAYGTTQVDQNAIFTQIVRRELPSIVHEPVEVLNASAGAWAIDNELSYVRSRGIFQSDIVLLVLNDGDLNQPRSTIAQIGDNTPVSRPATAIGELYTRYFRPRIFHILRRPDAGDSASEGGGDIARENLADLDAFQALVAGQHAEFVIVFTPFRIDVPVASARAETAFRSWAAAHQVPFLDLTAAEQPHPVREITLEGVHFNKAGNRVVAEAIEKSWTSIVQPQKGPGVGTGQ